MIHLFDTYGPLVLYGVVGVVIVVLHIVVRFLRWLPSSRPPKIDLAKFESHGYRLDAVPSCGCGHCERRRKDQQPLPEARLL